VSLAMLAVTFSLLLGAPVGEPAPSLRYLGKLPDGSGRARILYGERHADVRAGARIPGWGVVRAVNARELVVRRTLTDAEKQAREAEGLPAADVLDMRIPLAVGNLAAPVAEPR
jgi:hypothetical protein